MTSLHLSRRRFLQQSAAASAGLAFAGPLAAEENKSSPHEKLNIAVIGVNGRGGANLAGVASENLVALVDVDETRIGKAVESFPKAKILKDYRKLLDQPNLFDAVVISTPDHHHAFAAIPALQLGKHVYCEKPLAHSVAEVRLMRQAAARSKSVTQMGTQVHAGDNYRRVVELVQSGAIGPVRRVDVWCSKRPTPGFRAAADAKPPAGLDYELWLGPAPYRPYHKTHLHFDWRWWWDFGGGMLADMACHFIDLPYWALGLRSPSRVEAVGQVTYKGDNDVPDLMKVEFDYPARGEQPPVTVTWYHGVQGPSLTGAAVTMPTYPGFGSGVLFHGEKGQLVADYGHFKLLPEDHFKEFQAPQPTLARSIGHHKEWIEACKGRGRALCSFDYGGAMTEAVLLGNVAYRSGKKLEWDEQSGRVLNAADANQYLQREYRKGWKLG